MPLIDPAQIKLVDTDEVSMHLGDFRANPLVVVLVRFYGSPSCQAFLSEVSDAVSAKRFPQTAKVVAIGGSSDDQARSFRYDRGVILPMLVDPEQRVRAAAGVGDLGRGLLNLRGAERYAAAMRNGLRPHMPTRDVMRAPGVAIFGNDLRVRWVHEGAFVGDYPSLDYVIGQTRAEVVTPRTPDQLKLLAAPSRRGSQRRTDQRVHVDR